MNKQILSKFEKKWINFYSYGWCDTKEDRDEFNKMEKELKSDLIEALEKQKQEFLECLPKEKKPYLDGDFYIKDDGFNECRQIVKSNIEKL